MNVNGARFQLLLGRDDWARCLDRDDDDAFALGAWWDGEDASPGSLAGERPATLPEWDAVRNEIILAPQAIELPATEGEAPLTQAARRAAAADRNGNVYRVADDGRSLLVTSAGSGEETVFWPAEPADCAPVRSLARLDFEPVAASAPAPVERYGALAVTCDDYLVVVFTRTAQPLLMSFDLIAGGSPVETRWPAALAIEALDMCARHAGGVWLLDIASQRLWELDGTLAAINTGQSLTPLTPAQVDDFQPLAGPPRDQPASSFPAGLDLRASPVSLVQAIAVEPFDASGVLLLDRDDAGQRSRVVRLRRTGPAWRADPSQWLPKLPASSGTTTSTRLPAMAHDIVYAAAPRFREAAALRLFIASEIGNQAHAFEVIASDDAFALQAPAELFPLRRYGGRALIRIGDDAYYDSGLAQPRWTRIVQQPRQRYALVAEWVTPVFDSGELGTTWDKLLLDACIPPDTAIAVESRAGDERSDLADAGALLVAPAQVIGSWLSEPAPQLRSTGPELPWLRREAARATRREAGTGTWELLFQNAQGRYLQLRLRLTSNNGTGTPRLRALRAWAPRFSYPQRFLPAVYREDTPTGAFLERWLANLESTYTQIEDRIANLQSLFDARTIPGDALPWLAQWFDLALDPAWDERRHRLLVRHAMDFFRWRGTAHGLRLALELAFDPCIDAAMFDGPRPQDEGAGRIRIAEAYQSRVVDTLVAQAAVASDGLRAVQRTALWTPAEGNAGLADRYAKRQGREATLAEQITSFSLVPPQDADAARQWVDFCTATLGFVPALGAAERARWQAFLQVRYASDLVKLNRLHGSSVSAFGAVTLPADLPTTVDAQADWQAFCEQNQDRRERSLWTDFLARRYRRIERLQLAQRNAWPSFEQVPLPDSLPATQEGQTDWLQFERQLLAMHRSAHRFSVLLPVSSVTADPYQLDGWLGLARRIVELEKPAHTTFDVRFYWAFNRVGEARLGLDTQLGAGSRASELIPDAVVGRAYLGASFVGGPARQHGRDRLSLDC